MTICCRRRSRALGLPGSNARGLLMAAASSAASSGETSAADFLKWVRAAASAP
jgi:hypothetical protein